MIRQPRLFAGRLAVLGISAALAVPSAAYAQMVTGSGMEDFGTVFGIEGRGAKGFRVIQLGCSVPANVLWPGDAPTFTLRVENQADQPLKAAGRVDVVHYGTRGLPGDIWKPQVFKIADLPAIEVTVNAPAKGAATLEVTPQIPETFGGYGLVLDLGDRGRAFAATCVRVPAADPGREWLPTYALDLPWPHEMSEEVYRFFKRVGVKGARTEGGYNTAEHLHIDWAMANDITLLLTVGCGGTPGEQQPLGRGRPWLNDDDSMKENVKEDLAWLPSFDDEFERYLKGVLVEHGWPKGPINAVELWNEPWEGVSISGWGADTPRYREIYTRMAAAVLAARKEAGVKVLIGGACSSSNTRDKLFCDGKDTFLPWLDFVSIHYQPMGADPALVPQWVNRAGEYGPVKVWDTESWVANSEDRVAAVIASMRSMGQSRTAGIYRGNVYEPEKHRVDGREIAVVQAWPPAAGVAASQKFIGQRPFRELLFKNGLPWIFVFDGLPGKPDDGTVVVVGNLGEAYDRNLTLFRSVRIDPDAKLTLSSAGSAFRLLDFYGNPVPGGGGAITVPLNGLGYFLRTDGSAGSFKRLTDALAAARIEGYAPVEVIARDLTAPVDRHPRLELKLTNVLNRPIQASLDVKLAGLTLIAAERKVAMGPHQTAGFAVEVSGGQPAADNGYRLSVTVDAGPDGRTIHEELLRANVIARRTITVDGNLEDWKDALPQPVDARQKIGASVTEKAYLPFQKWDEPAGKGAATAFLAWDEECFYFAVQATGAPDGLPRFETRDDDQYFYPEVVTDRKANRKLTWPAGVRRFSYRKDPDLPSGNGRRNIQIAFNAIPAAEKGMLTHPAGTMPRYMVYHDTDYEFALNQVGEKYGGGTEIFCLQKPGMTRKHFYPRQPKAPADGGPVKSGRLVVRPVAAGHVVECAIPWSEMPEVKKRLDAGHTVKFSYRVNDGGTAYELAAGRSVSKVNAFAFHNDWATHWANELEFGAER